MTNGAPIRRKSKEHIEQVQFVQFVRAFYPEMVCMAIPNGGDLSASQRVKLAHEGLLVGAPDVMIFDKDRPALAIEFKRPDGKGRVSDRQAMVHVQMEAVGIEVRVCKSADEAKSVFHEWLVGWPRVE